MDDLRSKLEDMGYGQVEADELIELFLDQETPREIHRAAALIRLVFLRVDRDSAAGCALRRALGFSGGASFNRAARDFGVSKQYLNRLQHEIEAKLGYELTFILAEERAAAAAAEEAKQAPVAELDQGADEGEPPADEGAGPSGGFSEQR